MAGEQNIGILSASTIRPFFVESTFPIVLSQDIQGGIHSITSSSNFNQINILRRNWGMLAFVYDEKNYYQLIPERNSDLLDDTNWVLFSGGSGGSLEWVDSVKGVYNSNGSISPPPVDGDRYLVGPSGAASFNGHSNKIAVFRQYLNGYLYTSPPNGCTLRVDNEPDVLYKFVGTSSATGTWYKELQNTVRYIYPISNNGLTFSYTTTTGQTPLMGYTYCVFYASFATSNAGTVSLSIDGNFYAPIKKVSSNTLTDLSSGDFGADIEYQLTYDNGVFQIFLSSASQGGTIGPAEPGDGTYTDGLFTDFTPSTPIGTPIDRFNEILKALVPPPAPDLNSWSVNPQTQYVTGRISYSHAQETTFTPAIVSVTFSANGDVTRGDSFTKNTFSGFRLGVTSKNSQPITGNDYYQNITGVLNSGVSANPNLPTPAYAAGAFGNGITGSIVLYLNSFTVSSVDLGSTYNAINTTANFDGGLDIKAATASKFSNGNPFEFFWYRTGSYVINKASTHINSGYNKITVKHILPNTTITLTSYEFLTDASTAVTSFNTSVPTSNFSLLNTKYLSGIQYYTTNNSLGYSVVANNVYRNTYYDGSDAGSFADVSVQGISAIYNGASYNTNIGSSDTFEPSPSTRQLTPPSSVNDPFTFETTFNVKPDRRMINGTSVMKTTVKRTVQGTVIGGTLSISNWFIDSVTSTSTVLFEDFNSEGYRLNNSNFDTISSVNGDSWNSQNSLLNTNQNALQVADGRLLYPSFNFSAPGSSRDTNPNWGLTPTNYTTCKNNTNSPIRGVQNRTWTREFNIGPTSWSVFNMRITWQNTNWVKITNQISANSCQLEIKLPGTSGKVTGWLDAANPLDPNSDLTLDGKGCLDGTSVPTSSNQTWVVNLGNKSTSNSQGVVLVRITAGPDWNGYIESITLKGGPLP